jgi:hypothetical protein
MTAKRMGKPGKRDSCRELLTIRNGNLPCLPMAGMGAEYCLFARLTDGQLE